MRKYSENHAVDLIQSMVVEDGISPDDILCWMDFDLGYVNADQHDPYDVTNEKWLMKLFDTLTDDELDEFIDYFTAYRAEILQVT
jgi:hypothetical protein